MYTTSEFRNGLKIEMDGDPWTITYFQHVKPGKGGAFVRTRLKNLKTGAVLEKTFKSGDKVGKPDLEEREMQYLYNDGTLYYFMDNSTYEQIALSADQVGDALLYIVENMNVAALFFNKEPLSVEPPTFVVLTVVKTEPDFRGDTATSGNKPATLETGAIVQVPMFVQEGSKIKVDTRTGAYIERA